MKSISYDDRGCSNASTRDTQARTEGAQEARAQARQAHTDISAYLLHMEHRILHLVGEHGVLGQWLTSLFSDTSVDFLLALYRVGALPDGRTVFPYITCNGLTIDGKVMAYGADGHRIKVISEKVTSVTWLHALDRIERPMPLPLFGEHLLRTLPFAPLCLVESEKTALVAKLWRPDCTWIATGGKSSFTADRCRVLAGRTILVWPDADAVGEWMEAAAAIGSALDIRFQFPTAYLNRIREGPPKDDLADLVVRTLREL